MRNAANELEALLKVLDKAGADLFVEEAAKALSLHDFIDLTRRYRRIQKQSEAEARRPKAEAIKRATSPAPQKRVAS